VRGLELRGHDEPGFWDGYGYHNHGDPCELFGAEATAAPHICQSCGADGPVAGHRLYLGPGAVLRCPACGHIALVAATLRDRHVVHLTGAWRLDLPRP
jgi:hypothetical protein